MTELAFNVTPYVPTQKKSVEIQFVGIPAGDYECFCWSVDKETFTRITGREPDEFDMFPDRPGMPFGTYKLYADTEILDQFMDVDVEFEHKLRVTMKVEREDNEKRS